MSITEVDDSTKKILQQRFVNAVIFYCFSIPVALIIHHITMVDFSKIIGITGLLNAAFIIWATFPLKRFHITIIPVLHFLILLVITIFFKNYS